MSHIVVLGLCKFNFVRKKDVKPSKMDDDLVDSSVLSYEDTEEIFTLFYFDMLKLVKSSGLLLQRVATI